LDTWKVELTNAARTSKVRFESVELVSNEAHARALIALLQAFVDDPAGLIFAEPRTPSRLPGENARPTDALIIHPDLGAFLVEVKGWIVDEISQIEAGTIFRRVGGYEEARNPWKQAQDASAQLQKATRKVVQRRGLAAKEVPHFDWVVAFPNISKASWLEKGYDKSLHEGEALFAEDLADPQTLLLRLKLYVKAKASWRLPFSREQLDHVREALGSSEVIGQRRQREPGPTNEKLGDRIAAIELKDKRLSVEQQRLIEARFDGRPQLIRGVAGSGKSIVLVKNLARLIDRKVNREQLSLLGESETKRFLVVCYNRTLVPFLRELFEESFRALTYRDPPPRVTVDIFYMNGLLYELSTKRGGPLTYQNVGDYKKHGDEKMRHIAAHNSNQIDLLAKTNPTLLRRLQYDAVYVDEGQDLFDEEYLLLMRLLREDRETGLRNIVIFYDDAQNLYGLPRPTWSNLGIQITGGRTSVMKTCFRNTRPTIEFAFNLLLGVTAETRVTTKQFADVAHLKENGLVVELSDRWQVRFADRSEGLTPDVQLFDTREQEVLWIAAKVNHLILDERVRSEDILVLFHGPSENLIFPDLEAALMRTCTSIGRLRKPFGKAGNPEKDKYIFENGALTTTTVQSAKGYDCPIVILAGADLFSTDTEGRASFYVGATRAKIRLLVSGLRGRNSLADEAKGVAELLATPATANIEASSAQPKEEGDKPSDISTMKLLRKGDIVRHPAYGVGEVLEDGVPKFLRSQGLHDQSVRVQFEDFVKDIGAAGIAGLIPVQGSADR
jgi:superfamily I DNA and RNA helicase